VHGGTVVKDGRGIGRQGKSPRNLRVLTNLETVQARDQYRCFASE
jgi:hypothetical protein